MQPTALTRTHRVLIGVVVAGAVVIAGVGFAGSYSAVRDLAERKGFGWFAAVFPLGIDAGIVVLLALDLLLTWIRIPFPLLRQMAWLLTAATVAFNGAAAWPDPLGVGMHATIPLLFITTVEAARHAIGRIADITADRHMDSVRLTRWLLATPSTFRLWRRMKLWELRSYDHALNLERDRLVYRTRLRATYGRTWRRTAPPEALLHLKLAKYGVPIPTTAPPQEVPRPPVRQVPAPTPAPVQAPAPVPVAPIANGHSHAELREKLPRPRPAPAPAASPSPPPTPPPPPVNGHAARREPERGGTAPEPPPAAVTTDEPSPAPGPAPAVANGGRTDRFEVYYAAFSDLAAAHQRFPEPDELSLHLFQTYRISGRPGQPISPNTLRRLHPELSRRYAEDHDLPA